MTDQSAIYAQSMIDRRREQDALFGIPLRGTLAWDLLLALYVADANGRETTKRAVVDSIAIRPEIGRRWLSYLGQHGMILDGDLGDFDASVALAPGAIDGLERYIRGCLESGVRFYPV